MYLLHSCPKKIQKHRLKYRKVAFGIQIVGTTRYRINALNMFQKIRFIRINLFKFLRYNTQIKHIKRP